MSESPNTPSPAPRNTPSPIPLLSNLDPQETVIVAGSGAAALLCFFTWWKVSMGAEMGEMEKMFGGLPNSGGNAFSTWEGVVVFLFCVATGAVIPLARAGIVKLNKQQLVLATLGGSAGAVLFMLISFGRGGSSGPVSLGHTFWFYLAFVAVGLVAWKSFERWKAANLAAPPAA